MISEELFLLKKFGLGKKEIKPKYTIKKECKKIYKNKTFSRNLLQNIGR